MINSRCSEVARFAGDVIIVAILLHVVAEGSDAVGVMDLRSLPPEVFLVLHFAHREASILLIVHATVNKRSDKEQKRHTDLVRSQEVLTRGLFLG